MIIEKVVAGAAVAFVIALALFLRFASIPKLVSDVHANWPFDALTTATAFIGFATLALWRSTNKLARATQLQIATDAPLIFFDLTLDPAPSSVQSYPLARHDPAYLIASQIEDARFGIEDVNQRPRYVRVKFDNVQTRPYAAARDVTARFLLTWTDKAGNVVSLARESEIIAVIGAEQARELPIFDVSGLGTFECTLKDLKYQDLHSKIRRKAGYGTVTLAVRVLGGEAETEDGISQPSTNEVPS